MYYEINISKGVVHYFATAKRSITTKQQAQTLYADLKKRFPRSEGFIMELYRYECIGTPIEID
jgi:hypothetical protein